MYNVLHVRFQIVVVDAGAHCFTSNILLFAIPIQDTRTRVESTEYTTVHYVHYISIFSSCSLTLAHYSFACTTANYDM